MSEKLYNDIEEVIATTPQAQFLIGKQYYDLGNYDHAERLIRYASMKGFKPAHELLQIGIELGRFRTISDRLNVCAISILECLVTLQPTEEQITSLEKYISDYLTKQYGLNLNE